jgi:hypothetical protein
MSDQTDMNRGFMKEKLGNYQVDPPEKVWNAISGQIGNGRKRRGMYILLLATAASFALAVTLGIHFFGPDLPQQQSRMEELQGEQGVTEKELPKARERQTADSTQDERDQVEVEPLDAHPVLAMQQMNSLETEAGEPQQGNQDPVPVTIPYPLDTPDPVDMTDLISDPVIQLLPDSAGGLNTDPFPIMEPDKKRDPRWMVGAVVSPLYSYRDAEAVAMPSSPSESGMLSYSTGVNVNYRRNSRLAFETGIYYNSTGITIGAPGIRLFNQRSDAVYFGPGLEMAAINTVSNSVGNIVAYSGDIYMNGYKINAENGANALADFALDEIAAPESGIEQHLDFLEIPFNLRYSVIDRTIELQVVGGMSTNFLVGNSVTIEGPSGREEIGYLSNVNTVNYSANAGMGMIYHMGRKMSLILEPRFRYFINSVNDASLPDTRPYSLGFYTGLSYTF